MQNNQKGPITNKQKLAVSVVAGRGLVKADTFSMSDPFVTLIVRDRGTLKSTTTKVKTITPEWKEDFEL
jgi:Ca2+-dependent lipid-binding protein